MNTISSHRRIFPKWVVIFLMLMIAPVVILGCSDVSITTDPISETTTESVQMLSDSTISCTDASVADLIPPNSCGPFRTTTEIPPNNLYAASAFGCWRKSDGSLWQDPQDNCKFACSSQEFCPMEQSEPECQAELKWFAASADRFGCGTHIKVTNCENGKSIILVTLDRGPDCISVEQKYQEPILDMSYPAVEYLFGNIYGAVDRKIVHVEQVDSDTILGPVK